MPVLVGRETEQARLAAVLADLRAGRPALLALAGPAGIGKSALLADLTDIADYGGRVVRWRGVPAQTQLPFAALSGLLGALPRDDAGRNGDGDGDGDARETLDRAFGRGEPHPIGRLQVGAAAMTVIARAAEREPVLLVVDDLHWVDAESIEALLFALQRLPADPVGLIIATRDVVQAESLGIETLTLDGLAPVAVRDLIGPDVAETVCAAIGAATAGNPLASKEIAATLTATQRSGQSSLPDPFPETSVERVYTQRITATPEASRRAA